MHFWKGTRKAWALCEPHLLFQQNLELLDALGALLAEAGPACEAVTVLQRAAALSPDAGFEKYMRAPTLRCPSS